MSFLSYRPIMPPLIVLIWLLPLWAISNLSMVSAAPTFSSYNYLPSRSRSQSLSKRFFSYSSGWGPGGISVSQDKDSSHTAQSDTAVPSPASSMVDRLADQYGRDGRMANCAACERVLETLKAELENHPVQEWNDEEAAEVQRKIEELLEAVKKWKEVKAKTGRRSRRSVIRSLALGQEIGRI